ncbi:hypothetical protein [Streptomyces coffeae]|uniref:Uncharacterized protein n=1 Tax=Streptomyces coffeae TaxID=621382 RepID=A0ABS1NDX7_9ACTN|nr:hypothetical protein [Streptomyces coffeae]MBL1098286.1 hypothetical protein [Streptomyces coffeae]
MTPPHNVDKLLADAEILQNEYDDEDTAASRLRIEREVADTWWRSALLLESSAQRVRSELPEDAPRDRARVCTAQHEQAAYDLRKLSTLVIRDTRAAHHIALLARSCRVEPASALIFACLLHLADREGAQFWWQFSAGAGSATAALCLHLMHTQRGELRDAEHWAHEAAFLEDLENQSRPDDDLVCLLRRPPRQGHRGTWYTPQSMIQRTMAILHSGVAASTRVVDSPALAAPPLCRSLAVAVQRLEAKSDDDYGTIPKASFELAARLEDCAVSSL